MHGWKRSGNSIARHIAEKFIQNLTLHKRQSGDKSAIDNVLYTHTNVNVSYGSCFIIAYAREPGRGQLSPNFGAVETVEGTVETPPLAPSARKEKLLLFIFPFRFYR